MKDKIFHKLSHRQFNNILSFFVILLALYIALVPVLPILQFWWSQKDGVKIPYDGRLAAVSQGANKQNKPIPEDNRLVIPGLSLDEQVKEGQSLSVINNNGVWRRPGSSSNPSDGNMVLVGHRFTYTNPYGTFYHLDKLKVGDNFALYWEGEENIYKVIEVKTVSVNSVQIEQNTEKPILTMYTCTPIWSAKDRLVVTAERINL